MTTRVKGKQRLSVERLQAWEALRYGMFIHFGMSTFTGQELPSGEEPSTRYAPDKLDVDQWVSVARDAGMQYAVLTTKHVAGHALWPSQHTDYHVGTSGNPTDVVDAFVNACEKRGVRPGFYYCSWDNHNRFGSLTPSNTAVWERELFQKGTPAQIAFVSRAYLDFQAAQIEELLTRYGPVAEVWIDIPGVLPRFYRQELYDRMAGLQPDAVIVMNSGFGDGAAFNTSKAWPTDVITIERFLPNSTVGHVKWRNLEGGDYYLPAEVCDPIGKDWFYVDHDAPRPDAELLGMYLLSVSRGANLLLDVPPDRHGLIPRPHVDALMRMRRNLDTLGLGD